jgi:hypothetical protein
MVDWFNIISTIIGSGLFLSVFNLLLNDLILVPRLFIDVEKTATDGTIIKVNNNGFSAATGIVLTIKGEQLSNNAIYNTNTNDIPNNTNVNLSQDMLQMKMQRMSAGMGSVFNITLNSKPDKLHVYVTYDKGSAAWPGSKNEIYNDPTFPLVITLSILGIIAFISSLLWRGAKRSSLVKKFISKVIHDMEQVQRELHDYPYWTHRYWQHLDSTKGWSWKSRLIMEVMEEPDSELFKEFYSKIIFRDYAINRILEEMGIATDETKNDNKRKIEDCTKKITYSDTFKILPKGTLSTTNNCGLSTSAIKAIYNINKDLHLAAHKCCRMIHWSIYDIHDAAIKKQEEKDGQIIKNEESSLYRKLIYFFVSLSVLVTGILIHIFTRKP